LPQTWNESEKKIIELKYKSPQIANLNHIESWGKMLMTKIHIITGWVMPEILFMDMFIEQFVKKLQEDYYDLNVDEIEYAFRSQGTTVKDWGKSMNLSLIDEVLIPYKAQRFEASKAEERAKYKPEQKIYTLEELENIQRADIEAFYQRCLNGVRPPDKLPDYFLPLLIKDGYLGEGSDDLHGFFSYWINRGYRYIYKNEK
jgi:hypothetical protein